VVLELADEFENLEGVESEVGQKLAVRGRVDRAPAQAFQNLDNVRLVPLVSRVSATPGVPIVRLIRYLGQTRKGNMNTVAGVRSMAVNEPSPVRQTIILAAGNGSRLGSRTSGVPKPLVTVAGAPLIAHALTHAHASGCREAVVVLGYEGPRVRAAIEALPIPMQVRFVENPDLSTPNGVSLLAAAPLAASRFFLQMVDHVFGQPTLARLTASPLAVDEAGRVLVDRAPGDLDLDDATKVRVEAGRVTAIGKSITPWDAIDAGCFVLTSAVFDALREVEPAEAQSVSSGMRRLVTRGALGIADVDGVPWVDVDTPHDHAVAERLLGARR